MRAHQEFSGHLRTYGFEDIWRLASRQGLSNGMTVTSIYGDGPTVGILKPLQV